MRFGLPVLLILGMICGTMLPLAGCHSHDKDTTLIVTPVVYTNTNIDPFDHTPPARQRTEVDLFYATNRERKGEVDDPIYTNGMDRVLRMGEVTVRLGEEGLTWQELHKASKARERSVEIPISISSVSEHGVLGVNVSGKPLKRPLAEDYTIGDASFAAAINERLAQSTDKEINLYMHGFKVPFDHGPKLAAQLHHFGNRRGVMIAFDWACRQKDITYAGDVKRGKRSVDDLAEFLIFLATHTDAERISIICWSAGAPIMSGALRNVRERYPDLDHEALVAKLKLHTVIFAASDVDFRGFAEDLVHFSELPERLIVTVCYDDPQLKLSRAIHGRKSRLGSLDISELKPEELESLRPHLPRMEFLDITFDQGVISETHTATGHHYFFRNPWVLTDVLAALYLDLPADKRGLLPVEGHTNTWYFPEDYAQRSADAIYAIHSMRNQK